VAATAARQTRAAAADRRRIGAHCVPETKRIRSDLVRLRVTVSVVTALGDWPAAPILSTERLKLEPLQVDHAAELAPLFNDPDLHTFTGGTPATVAQLRATYSRQVVGHSTDLSPRWLNWIVRARTSGIAVGTVQATVRHHGGSGAELAWVIASAQRRHGYAHEAAAVMVDWLRSHGATNLTAHVHPDHEASMAVCRALALRPTNVTVDGEVHWTG